MRRALPDWSPFPPPQDIGFPVGPGQAISLPYYFRPDPALPPHNYVVAATVFYQSLDGEEYSTTFFNQTVLIAESTAGLGSEDLMLYGMMAAAVAAIGYLVYGQLIKFGIVKKSSKKRTVERGTTGGADREEWLKGTSLDAKVRARKAAAKN